MNENYETFFNRLRPYFAPSQVRRIELAYMLAKYAHRAQVRKEVDEHGDPVRYFEHVRKAALVAIDLAKIVRLDTTIALVLHDTFEDTKLTPEIVEDCFGTDVCSIVKTVSKVPKEGYFDRLMISTDWRSLFCKGCDHYQNYESMPAMPIDFRRKQVAESKDKYFRLFDRMVMLTPEEYRDGTRRLRDAIQQTVEAVPLT